jgi:hypothetical protein
MKDGQPPAITHCSAGKCIVMANFVEHLKLFLVLNNLSTLEQEAVSSQIPPISLLPLLHFTSWGNHVIQAPNVHECAPCQSIHYTQSRATIQCQLQVAISFEEFTTSFCGKKSLLASGEALHHRHLSLCKIASHFPWDIYFFYVYM